MPTSINYDLGYEKPIDSLRISFYKWEAGRLYQYSIFASNDSVNWTPVIQEVWSDSLEWTEIIIDSIGARFVKLELLQSNEGPFASIWEFETFGSGELSSVEPPDISPSEFVLYQNYPNPFNPSTKIKVNLKQGTHLRLAVYNMLGELVTEITNAEYSEGIHQFDFDATGLASGIYIYRAESSVFTDTKKMILLR